MLGEGGPGRVLDIKETPDEHRGAWGTGSIHHLAWRVNDDAHELAVRSAIEASGLRPTPVIDRFWFKSVYFKEPGGVLFELATDGPGFAVDEDPAHLGETLVLPPWLEAQRTAIERAVPALAYPPVLADPVDRLRPCSGATRSTAAGHAGERGDIAERQRGQLIVV